MGEVCSHLSEGERRVIQIEIGNGAGIRGIGLMPGRNASTAGGEAKRNTWVPVRRERVLPAVPACVLSSCYRPVWREFSFRKSGRF
jgi:hypothetical protein